MGHKCLTNSCQAFLFLLSLATFHHAHKLTIQTPYWFLCITSFLWCDKSLLLSGLAELCIFSFLLSPPCFFFFFPLNQLTPSLPIFRSLCTTQVLSILPICLQHSSLRVVSSPCFICLVGSAGLMHRF